MPNIVLNVSCGIIAHNHLESDTYFLYFKDKELETQRDQVACPKSYNSGRARTQSQVCQNAACVPFDLTLCFLPQRKGSKLATLRSIKPSERNSSLSFLSLGSVFLKFVPGPPASEKFLRAAVRNVDSKEKKRKCVDS